MHDLAEDGLETPAILWKKLRDQCAQRRMSASCDSWGQVMAAKQEEGTQIDGASLDELDRAKWALVAAFYWWNQVLATELGVEMRRGSVDTEALQRRRP
jgi:hypothetical protein